MSTYLCKVVDPQGNRQVFHRDAAHEASVLRDLNHEGYFILSVSPAQTKSAPNASRIKPALVLEFTQILATLMSNGLKLKEALSISQRLGGKGGNASAQPRRGSDWKRRQSLRRPVGLEVRVFASVSWLGSNR